MLSLLVMLLFALVVGSILYWIVSLLPLAPPLKQVALVIVALIVLVMVLHAFGVVGPRWWRS